MNSVIQYSLIGMFAVALSLAAFGVYAGGPANKATGTVVWTARTHLPPAQQLTGLVSSFNAHDLGPGALDKGQHTISRPADAGFAGGSLTMNVKCARVDDGEAWFAGEVVEAEGGYSDTIGDVFLYWVLDKSTPGEPADEIGGRGYDTLAEACDDVDAGAWEGTGDVTDGNLKTHYRD